MKESTRIRTKTRVNILGIGANPITMEDALDQIGDWIVQREKNYVCVMPAHSVMDCFEDPELRRIFNRSGMTTPDGMSIVWLLKLNGYRFVERVYGPDLMISAMSISKTKKWRHYFLGGTQEVLDRLQDSIRSEYPGVEIRGTFSPPFRPLTQDEENQIVKKINESQADILWVGMGSPRQEKWMAENKQKMDVPVMIGVGAAFDFLSGAKPQAPQWVQKSGMEWFYRLCKEPGRLWKRYIRYPKFVILALCQLLKLKEYSIEE
jgi:N-acetylglucosaminyldiphosphoundecaprenol N-acetyl-beta-D-mannosaminyltransferase